MIIYLSTKSKIYLQIFKRYLQKRMRYPQIFKKHLQNSRGYLQFGRKEYGQSEY
jgi:hypothetical protein